MDKIKQLQGIKLTSLGPLTQLGLLQFPYSYIFKIDSLLIVTF